MSKYTILTEYLSKKTEKSITLSFDEIEEILGFSLPKSAYNHKAWWANSENGHSQTRSWLNAGWSTKSIELIAKKITFHNNPFIKKNGSQEKPNKLTIADAKIRLAQSLGVSVKNIEIIIRT